MRFRPPHFRAAQSAFTMVEIAISLAVIGIALVAIIGVLPLGMNVQRDNREETVINQDATIFLDAISHGARGLNDLTNYVYGVTNAWTEYNPDGTVKIFGANGYDYSTTVIAPGYFVAPGVFTPPAATIRDGTNIIGLLSTPEFTDVNGVPANNLFNGGYSNHILAYVRSLSGAATEKPPQDNQIIQQDAFGYRLLCVNAPVPLNVPVWSGLPGQSYNPGDEVFYNGVFWRATAIVGNGDIPGISSLWTKNSYATQLTANLHEVRLTFLWPVLPNGGIGNGRQSYRTLVAGQILQTNSTGQMLYFYQSQSFTNSP